MDIRFQRSTGKQGLSRISLFLIPIIGALALVASCQDSITDAPPPDIVFPDSGVSFGRHVEPLFTHACATAQCHGGDVPADRVNLEPPSYQKLLNFQPQLVVQHDGDHSLLVQRLDGRIAPVMPIGRQPLTQNQVKGIKRWIDEGAQNN